MSMSLRGGKRVDYSKMVKGDGSELELGSDDENNICTGSGHQVLASEKESEKISSVDEVSSPDEAEMESLERKLAENMRLKKKLEKKEKLRRLSEEVKRTSKSLKGNKKNSKQVNISTLRGMEDVRQKVDRLMDKKLGSFDFHSKSKGKNRKKYLSSSASSSSSSSGSESDSSSSASSSDSSSSEASYDEGRKKKHKKTNKKYGKKSKQE